MNFSLEKIAPYSNKIYKTKYIMLISVIIIFINFHFSISDVENSRSIISTVIQSLASILAIVISLTLVAVQLSSQNYSTRMLKMFISSKNTYFWLLIGLYSITIIYNLFLLNILTSTSNTIDFLGRIGVIISILLAIWSVLLLPKYLVDLLDRLSPERVINELVKQIDKDFIFKLEESDFKFDSNKNPLIPLIDIIIGAIKNGHTDTTKTGLTVLKDQLVDLNKDKIVTKGMKLYSYLYKFHIRRAEKIAVIESDSRTTEEILFFLTDIRFLTFIVKTDFEITKIIDIYGQISRDIISIGFKDCVELLIDNFRALLTEVLKNEYGEDTQFTAVILIIEYIQEMLNQSKEKRISDIENYLEYQLKFIIRDIGEANSKNLIPVLITIEFLTNDGLKTMENDPNTTDNRIKNLQTLYRTLVGSGIKKLTESGKKDIIGELDGTIELIASAFKNLGIESIERKNYEFKKKRYMLPIPISRGADFKGENPLIMEIINNLHNICFDYLDTKKNRRVLFDANGEADLVVMRISHFLSEIGLRLIKINSIFINNVLFSIYFAGSGAKFRITPKEDITLTSLDLLYELGRLLIKNRMRNNSMECARYLKDIGLFGINENYYRSIELSIAHLRDLGIEFVKNKEFKKCLVQLLLFLDQIAMKLIEVGNYDTLDNYVQSMKLIIEEMKKQEFKNSEIENSLENLIFISEALEREKKKELAEEIKNNVQKIRDDLN